MTTTDMNGTKATVLNNGQISETNSDQIAVEKAVLGFPVEQAMPLPGGLREDVIKSQVQELKALFPDPTSFEKYAELLTSGLRGETSVLTSFNSSHSNSEEQSEKSGINKFNNFHESIREKITAHLNETDSERVNQFLENLADGVRAALQDPKSKLSATKIVVNQISPEDYAQVVRDGTKEWVKDICDSIKTSPQLEAKITGLFEFALDRLFVSHDGFSKAILGKKIAQACKEHGVEMPKEFRDIIDSLASELPANPTESKLDTSPAPHVALTAQTKPAATPSVIEAATQINPNRDQDLAALKKAEQSVCDRLNAEYKKLRREGMPSVARDFIHKTFETIAEKPQSFNAKFFEREMRAGLESNAIPSNQKIDVLIKDVVDIGMARKNSVLNQTAGSTEGKKQEAPKSFKQRSPEELRADADSICLHIDTGIQQGALRSLVGNEKLYMAYFGALNKLSERLKTPGVGIVDELTRFSRYAVNLDGPQNPDKQFTTFINALGELILKAGMNPKKL